MTLYHTLCQKSRAESYKTT